MKAIETRYNGQLFRSRLEARWAVLMDVLGVRHQYEPEGFRFDVEAEPVLYLPDFYLPDFSAWLEIKPTMPTGREQQKCALLAAGHSTRVYLLAGQLPDIDCTLFYGWPDGFVEEHERYAWDGRELFGGALLEAAVDAAINTRFEHRQGRHGFVTAGDVIANANDGLLGSVRRAIDLPRSAKPRPEGTETA